MVGEIGLGQQQPVGYRRLLDGFDLAIERIAAIDCIDRSDDSVQAIAPRDDWVGHQRVEDRGRIREPGGLDHHPVEPWLASARKTSGDLAQGLGKVAPDGAAEAATRHLNDDVILAVRHEIMVEANLPELVDEHQCPAQRGLLDQIVEDSRLAAAKKPGQHRDRQWPP